MIGGQQNMQEEKAIEGNVNPEKEMDVEVYEPVNVQQNKEQALFESFREENKKPEEINNQQAHIQISAENEVNQMNLQQDQSRPSPAIDESVSQSLSNPKQGKVKPLPLANQLLRLTKKSVTSVKQRKQREKKVRCFITDFQPYLPNFLDEMHREHHKNIVRIGQNYQAHVQSQPRFESLHRPMNHLRIWKGSEEKLNKDVLKKFREIYGQNRTEEELILLKNRLQSESWSDLMKEMTALKQAGKKSSLVVANNNGLGATTRNK